MKEVIPYLVGLFIAIALFSAFVSFMERAEREDNEKRMANYEQCKLLAGPSVPSLEWCFKTFKPAFE